MKSWYRSKSGNDGEKQSLRGHSPSWSLPCVIRSRKALTYSTRLVFAVTILTGFGVIFASIWFMLDCRQKFNSIQGLIPRHSSFCTNLGMQALFACCVLLFTIFGLGCIGRRMTGHAILIISGVAIFQGAMTLTFYQCRTMADDDIMNAVNATLNSCRVGVGPPFASLHAGVQETEQRGGDRSISIPIEPTTTTKTTATASRSLLPNATEIKDVMPSDIPIPSSTVKGQITLNNNDSLNSNSSLNLDLKRKLVYSIQAIANEQERDKPKPKLTSSSIVKCHEKSSYFIAFAANHDGKEVRKCKEICNTYLNFCQRRNINSETERLSKTPINRDDNDEYSGSGLEFNYEARACGENIAQFVRHFCIYDSRIFTPLSLGTPIFYMFMSFCFIYLARCDRQSKEEDDEECLDPSGEHESVSKSSSKSPRRLHSKGKSKKRAPGYSSSSPAIGFQDRQEGVRPLPSPALSDRSGAWQGRVGIGTGTGSVTATSLMTDESEISQQHSTSARTIETFLGEY